MPWVLAVGFLLDLMLPGLDGFTVCRKLREKIDTPILMVTARREDVDKIRGLGLGADDYIEKPFSSSVLAGAALSVRALRTALRKYRSRMLWLILGLMTGSLVSISMGPSTLDPPRSPLGPDNFNVLGFLLGIVILLGLEGLKKLTQKQEHCEQAAFMNQNGNMETL